MLRTINTTNWFTDILISDQKVNYCSEMVRKAHFADCPSKARKELYVYV